MGIRKIFLPVSWNQNHEKAEGKERKSKYRFSIMDTK